MIWTQKSGEHCCNGSMMQQEPCLAESGLTTKTTFNWKQKVSTPKTPSSGNCTSSLLLLLLLLLAFTSTFLGWANFARSGRERDRQAGKSSTRSRKHNRKRSRSGSEGGGDIDPVEDQCRGCCKLHDELAQQKKQNDQLFNENRALKQQMQELLEERANLESAHLEAVTDYIADLMERG